MFTHNFHFYNNGFFISWQEVLLPYRVNKDDKISTCLFDDVEILDHEERCTEEWFKFFAQEELFSIDFISIEANGISVYMKICKD